MAPGGQERHSREAQGKSQENAADKNDDNHGVISLPFKKNPGVQGIAGCTDHACATEQSPKFIGLKIVSASSKVNWQKCLISPEKNYLLGFSSLRPLAFSYRLTTSLALFLPMQQLFQTLASEYFEKIY
jgi:hypothetical protein